MKLAISNIGWQAEYDEAVYKIMQKYGYTGLEIAPTRIITETPYDRLNEAKEWIDKLRNEYGFTVPSMQSIWFGKQEKLFGTQQERDILTGYTQKAVDFAAVIGCNNLVFGCPRNRVIANEADEAIGVEFFKTIGDYASDKGTVIGMEANPAIYNTNYINDTEAAIRLIKQVDSKGFLLNLDIGTMIQNNESITVLEGNAGLINHVHISEPGLKPIEKREIHKELYKILKEADYKGYVSIEMGKGEDVSSIERIIEYVYEVFHD